jgi:peptidoglycan hydrolase CwlO-like protein
MTEILLPALTAIIGAASSWFLARRKVKAEAVNTELDAIEKAVSIWRQLSEGLKAELDVLKNQYAEVHKELEQLRQENLQLKRKIKEMGK